MSRTVAIRFGTEGKAQVKADLDDIGNSGDANAKRWARSFDRAGQEVEAAMRRQAAAAAKIAAIAPQSTMQMRIGDANSTGFGQYEGSARASAAAFRDLIAEEDRLEARTRALMAIIDPASVAQQRYNAAVAEAKDLLERGRISTEQYGAAQARAREQLDLATNSTRQAAAAEQALIAEAGQLRAAIDPMFAAQQRFNTEMDRADRLFEQGAISAHEYAAAQTLARTALNAHAQQVTGTAAAVRDLAAEEERLEARTRALVAIIDPASAAQQRYSASVAEAKQLLDLGRISTEQFAAAQAHARTQMELATKSTRDAAAAERMLIGEAAQLRNAIDPMFAAQQRFNAEMDRADRLYEAGTISLREYTAAQTVARNALYLHARQVAGTTAAGTPFTNSLGAQRAAMQGLSFQAQDTFTQLSMGANIFQVVAIQGAQAAGQFANLEGRAGAFARFMIGPWGLAITGGMLVLGALTKGMFDNSEASAKAEAGMQKFQDRQSDIGNFIDQTTGKLKEQNRTLVLNAILTRQSRIDTNEQSIRESGTEAFDRARRAALRTTRAAPGTTTSGVSFEDDTQVQYVIRNARGDVGRLAAGLAELAKNRPELRAVALEVSTIGGRAIEAARENAKLGQELRALNGDSTALGNADKSMIEARAKLAGATSAMDRAQAQYTISIKEADAAYEGSKKTEADRARLLTARTAAEHALNVAQDANRKGGDRHAQSLARQSEAMEVNASAALDLARAYMDGGNAALYAEAARKGLTDATRKGIDGDAQVQRQLAIMIGDQLVNGAKGLDQLRDQMEARCAVNAQILAGSVPVSQMNQALSDEAVLRPLVKLQMVAQGDQLKVLTDLLAKYRQGLADAHAEEAKSGAKMATDAAMERMAELRSVSGDMSLAPLDRALNAAKRAAEREADAAGYKDDDTGRYRSEFIKSRTDEAQAQYQADRARFVQDTLAGQRDSLILAQRELALAGANDNFRTTELDKLKLILDIRRAFPDLAEADAQALLDGIAAQAQVQAELEKASRALDEMRGFGEDFVTTILSEDTWSSWGNAGKTVLDMIRGEFIKLILLNPLKNMINGNSDAPTIGGVLGNIGKLFGGGGASSAVTAAFGIGGAGTAGSAAGGSGLAKLASGTERWSGGTALLGEHGPEVAHLPAGTRVQSAEETRRLFAGNDNGGGSFHFDLRGAVVTQDLLDQMNAIGARSAVQGAVGGSRMAQDQMARMRRRRLPGT